ncbi:arylesterase [Polynucleobacter sp. IMCC 29146]|uniref:arylesterase n=1 Tax=Polynucleobacter sp. IMCC 29146 TaxID=2780953 RepID=UPI001F265FA3|nr:arylesterase [Polynucleobacter sp. IMCC 29146]MCE7528721.1 arylesterase [Polynucleobacter sp. IMCC 29146]
MLRCKLLIALILLVLGFFGRAHAEPSATSQTSSPKQGSQGNLPVLLVLGDSLSAEYGISRGEGWVSLLERRVNERGPTWQVFNASISGETTAGGLSRLPDLLQQKKPQIVIIELGANDALRGLALSSSEKNLRTMVQLSLKAKAKVLLLGMRIPSNYGATYSKQFASMYSSIATTERISIVPFFLKGVAEKPELFQADRLHPRAEAQAILLQNVWGKLAPLL